jgi:hypothetical protein
VHQGDFVMLGHMVNNILNIEQILQIKINGFREIGGNLLVFLIVEKPSMSGFSWMQFSNF